MYETYVMAIRCCTRKRMIILNSVINITRMGWIQWNLTLEFIIHMGLQYLDVVVSHQ